MAEIAGKDTSRFLRPALSTGMLFLMTNFDINIFAAIEAKSPAVIDEETNRNGMKKHILTEKWLKQYKSQPFIRLNENHFWNN